MLSFESHVAQKLGFKDTMNDFATKKACAEHNCTHKLYFFFTCK